MRLGHNLSHRGAVTARAAVEAAIGCLARGAARGPGIAFAAAAARIGFLLGELLVLFGVPRRFRVLILTGLLLLLGSHRRERGGTGRVGRLTVLTRGMGILRVRASLGLRLRR